MSSVHKEPQVAQAVPRHIRTRRNLWLSSNPSYFDQESHALSLPLAYDRLIRVYQSAAERQSEGRQQGWARMLEGALVRGEAKRDQAIKDRQQAREEEKAEQDVAEPPKHATSKKNGLKPLPEETDAHDGAGLVGAESSDVHSRWDVPLGIVPADEMLDFNPDSLPASKREPAEDGPSDTSTPSTVIDGLSKEQALGRWQELLRARFVAGEDEDVPYMDVDRESGQDLDWQESQRENDWFEDEAEHWVDQDPSERTPVCETGIQDF